MHPNIRALLKFFKYKHLPPELQEVSEPFCALAQTVAGLTIDETLQGPEVTVCLRKLLEAKDCAVRAALKD